MAKVQVSMSPTQAHGQTAMRIGDKTFTSDPQELDSGDLDSDEMKQALRDGKLVVQGLSDEDRQRLLGEESDSNTRATKDTAQLRNQDQTKAGQQSGGQQKF